MIVVDGYIGDDPEFRTAGAPLHRGGQREHRRHAEAALLRRRRPATAFEPELTVIYTPNLAVEGYPNDRVIAVDLERGVTRVCNSDYFGESKKGGLRMWNKLVYDRGGLPLHAGCKVIPTDSRRQGRPDRRPVRHRQDDDHVHPQNGSLPVQDDFVAMMPGGKVYATENGCFAKTFALSEEDEPTIHGAVTRPEAYLENVSQDDDGQARLLRHDLHAERPRDVLVLDDRGRRRARARGGRLPADPQPQREHHPGGGQARTPSRPRPTSCSARRRARAPAAPRRRASSCACRAPTRSSRRPRPPGQPLPGAHGRAPARRLPDEHRPRGRRRRASRAREKVRIPHSSAIVKAIAEGTIEWERRPGLRLPGGHSGAGHRRRRRRGAAPARALRVRGPRRRVREDRRHAEGRARRVPAEVPGALATRSSTRSGADRAGHQPRHAGNPRSLGDMPSTLESTRSREHVPTRQDGRRIGGAARCSADYSARRPPTSARPRRRLAAAGVTPRPAR